MLPFTVCPVGDTGLLVSFEQRISQSIGAAVAALNTRVTAAAIPGVVETVPAFASLLIFYDPLVTEYDAVAAAVQSWRRHRTAIPQQRKGGSLRFRSAMAGPSAPTFRLWQSMQA